MYTAKDFMKDLYASDDELNEVLDEWIKYVLLVEWDKTENKAHVWKSSRLDEEDFVRLMEKRGFYVYREPYSELFNITLPPQEE